MSKFKKGDKVKIVKAFPSMVEGLYYNVLMDNSIGKTGVILYKGKGEWWSVRVDGEEGDTYSWVESSLELFKTPINPMPELKSGMRVQHRNGDIFLVIKDLNRLFQVGSFNHLDHFDPETGVHGGPNSSQWDIVKVFEGHNNGNLMNLQNLGSLLWESDPAKIAKQKRRDELNDIIIQAKCELDSLSEY